MLSAPFLTPAEKNYQCYYPHRSRDSVSPVFGIFSFYYYLLIPRLDTQPKCLNHIFEPYLNTKINGTIYIFINAIFQKHYTMGLISYKFAKTCEIIHLASLITVPLLETWLESVLDMLGGL